MKNETFTFLDTFIWFFLTPVSIFGLIWLLVSVATRDKKAQWSKDVLSRINDQ